MAIRGLYAIADSEWNPCPSLAALVEEYLKAGVRVVQLRMKRPQNLETDFPKRVYETAGEIMDLKKRWEFTFIVNDYVGVALEVGADGVHIGANDMPILQVKSLLSPDMVIGYSSHSLDEAKRAEDRGADYVAFGAVYPTKTKGPGHPVQGVDALADVVRTLNVPVVAIGGIGRSNISEVRSTGVAAVAMITGLSQAPSIADEVRWYVERLSSK